MKGGLSQRIEALWNAGDAADPSEVSGVVGELLALLESGEIRAARPSYEGWTPVPWVKTGILLGFRHSPPAEFLAGESFRFNDKEWYPPRSDRPDGVRLVPGGSAIRRGAHVGPGTVLMPPCYVNVGAYVGRGAMIDSHALVGSCAQVGDGVHVSAGAQLGGVLEPPGALPVIVEDEAFVGGLAAVFEGVRIGRRAVVGAGVVLTASTPVFDLVHERALERGGGGVLEIPESAVVVAGTRPPSSDWARQKGLALAAALVVKYRDAGTDARAALERELR